MTYHPTANLKPVRIHARRDNQRPRLNLDSFFLPFVRAPAYFAKRMAKIPLEDNFTDIIGKAQRGWKVSDEELSQKSGVDIAKLEAVKKGEIDEQAIRKIASALALDGNRLLISARQGWYPRPHEVPGLAQFNTPYDDMTVNAYLAWDDKTKEAVAFDTGADARPMLEFAKARGLKITKILLTHTHPDHIAELARLKKETGASAHVSDLEPTAGAATFPEHQSFQLGNLKIGSGKTSGHSVGGTTFVISGLQTPVAVVGDSLFAGSMGGGGVSYTDALQNNRKKILTLRGETIICPGHGPLTSVDEERKHNPFFPRADLENDAGTSTFMMMAMG
jgi:glyoxylase-like metal-dependent hydrolase (beta-lactamase superfamily II)